MRLLLLIAAALARPEELLERGTSHYNNGDAAQAHRAFVRLSTDTTAAPHLRAQAHQGLAALAQRRGAGPGPPLPSRKSTTDRSVRVTVAMN